MSLGKRIAEARGKAWSQAKLAKAIGRAQGTIGQWETDEREPDLEMIERVARTLSVDPCWLAFGRDAGDDGQLIAEVEPDQRIFPVGGEEYAAIRRFDLQASAGPGREIPAIPDVLHHHLFRVDWLRTVTRSPLGKLFVLEVLGDSMEPTLRTGDTVLVDQAQNHPRRLDGLYVLNFDGAMQVKRVSAHPVSNLLRISSDNPRHAPWPDISPDDIDIVGRVIWIGRQV